MTVRQSYQSSIDALDAVDTAVETIGQPIGFHITGGEASDSRQLQLLLDIGPDKARAAMTNVNRAAARRRGICLDRRFCR